MIAPCRYCFVDAEHNYVEPCSSCFNRIAREYDAEIEAGKTPHAKEVRRFLRRRAK
jgi:hypothetical protein